MTVKFSKEDIQNITLFENLTKTRVRDHIATDDTLYFVIEGESLGVVIGKDGAKIKRIQDKMKKNIKIFKHSKDLEKFVKNILNVPVIKMNIMKKGNKKIIKVYLAKDKRRLVVGKRGKNIKIITEFLKRQYSIDNIILGD